MNDIIKAKLNTAIRSNSDVAKRIDDFRKKSLTDKRLPLGILADIATASGCLPPVLSNYLGSDFPTKNDITWNKHARDNFDSILEIVVEASEPAAKLQPTTKNSNN